MDLLQGQRARYHIVGVVCFGPPADSGLVQGLLEAEPGSHERGWGRESAGP